MWQDNYYKIAQHYGWAFGQVFANEVALLLMMECFRVIFNAKAWSGCQEITK
jgi:hypothetical protein